MGVRRRVSYFRFLAPFSLRFRFPLAPFLGLGSGDFPGEMREVLRTIEWARQQLGHQSRRSARRWLKKHGVHVVCGKFLESAFYRVWEGAPAIDVDALIEEAFRDDRYPRG